MKSVRVVILLSIFVVLTHYACHAGPGGTDAPFVVKFVPEYYGSEGSNMSMGKDSMNEFFVIVTNVSDKPQYLWEEWNSWGYYCLSFQIKTPDGTTHKLARKSQGFTRNFPSTMLVPPGEPVVFPVTLDESWEVLPSLAVPQPPNPDCPPPPSDITEAIDIVVFYEVSPSKEATNKHVWVGRVPSKSYHVFLRRW